MEDRESNVKPLCLAKLANVPKEVALRESIRYQVPWYDRATDAPTTPDALASDTTDTKAAAAFIESNAEIEKWTSRKI